MGICHSIHGENSMCLVMMICITRTFAMEYSNRPIKRPWVVGSITGYAAYMMVMYLVYIPQGWHFEIVRSSCIIEFFHDSKGMPWTAKYFGTISYFVELAFPSFITFVCFIIGIWFLKTWPAIGNGTDSKFHRASLTISLFTVVFLVCNIPCFLALMWNILYFSLNEGPRSKDAYTELMLQFCRYFWTLRSTHCSTCGEQERTRRSSPKVNSIILSPFSPKNCPDEHWAEKGK